MKNSLLLVFLLSFCFIASAQMVSETVDFDYYTSSTDNDFENRFDNGLGLIQIQTDGITGGCLQTPTTIAWGNDNAVYCTRFKGVIGETYITGICFKYDTSQFNNINFDRPVSLWMKPYVDPNHYIVASVLDTRRIQIISYSATSTSPVMQLQQGHWYNLLLTTDFVGGIAGDGIDIGAQVNDLGLSGGDPPIPVSFTNTPLNDSIMIADTSIEVSITGTSWGGAQYLDNFRFDGIKSYDNCITTAVEEYSSRDIFSSLNGTTLVINTGTVTTGVIEIHDVQGKKLAEKKITSEITTFETNGIPSGVYFLSVRNERINLTKKFILNKL